MADVVDTILEELLDSGWDYHEAYRWHLRKMQSDEAYRDKVNAGENPIP